MLPQLREPILPVEPTVARAVPFDVEERRASHHRTLRHLSALAVQAVVLAGLVSLFFVRIPQVDGHSMAPQIDAGDRVLLNTVAYDIRIDRPGGDPRPLVAIHLKPVMRGDVIAFVHGSGDGRRIYLKRVIGVPGDVVAIERGVVSVNGRTLVEAYDPLLDYTDMRPQSIPAGSFFVLGDNRGDSDDSRSFGPVPATEIVGRAVFVTWPPGRVRAIR